MARTINYLRIHITSLLLFLLVCSSILAVASESAAESNGLTGKLIVGYQGWFGCPNDFEGNPYWQHWFVKGVRPEYFTVDMLPSLREMNPKDLCDTGLPSADGKNTIKLFSSQNPNIVSTHFRWMREHGIDGAAVQRFIAGMSDPMKKKRFNNVLKNVRAAAEANNRSFFVAYDVSGGNTKTVVNDIRTDWQHLVNDLKLTSSPNYLRDNGKPVLELWGFGFPDRPGNVEEVAALIDDLKNGRNGLTAVTIIGGVPKNWRTLGDGSKTEPIWAKVYRKYDVISPWSVGRFDNEAGADSFKREYIIPDLAETKRLNLRYMPVIFPGFSWYNLMKNRNEPGKAILNQYSRRCGQFMWRQFANSLEAGADTLYVAMFDELDEGTAIFPAETRSDKLPAGSKMVYLNQDGCSLPDDWYLKITGEAAKALKGRSALPKKLESIIRQ